MRKLCLSALLISLSSTMFAQQVQAVPPAAALFGTISGNQVAFYEVQSALGPCFNMDVQPPGQAWYTFNSFECGLTQDKVDSHGGAVSYITWILPDINARIQAQFGGGSDVSGQVNTSLTNAFKINNGELVPK